MSTATITTLAEDAVQWTEAEGGNGHWYQFIFLPGDCIHICEQQANAMGASLATIQSDGENAFVDSLIPDYNGWYSVGRIGAYQDENAPSPSSGWNWITGEPWKYTAWSPHGNQPNDGGDEPHIVIYSSAHTGPHAGWHDNTNSCGVLNELGWIIEWSTDCNNDGIVDYGQILDGTLVDTDQNGVPDWCDSCTGDVNGDGTVDAADLGALLALWGTNGNSSPRADANQDGIVDAADLGLLLGYWGDCP